jgi:hypothetical protein
MPSSSLSLVKSSLWANRRCLLICSFGAIAHTQYGIDTAAIGGLHTVPGLLKICLAVDICTRGYMLILPQVFGYEDPTLPIGYDIVVGDPASFSDPE